MSERPPREPEPGKPREEEPADDPMDHRFAADEEVADDPAGAGESRTAGMGE